MLPTVDSTNNYAIGQATAGEAGHGTVYFALEQTAGKGQRGKTWLTTTGENIMMSVVLHPHPLKTSQQFLLSAAIALGCYDFFKNYAGEETSIKWPNDLYWRDRKAGGILIESRIRSSESGVQSSEPKASTASYQSSTQNSELTTHDWIIAIAGMGININQTKFAPEALRPVSLKQITGKTYDINALARELCHHLEKRYQAIRNPEQLLADYHQALYKKGKSVKLKKGTSVFETTIQGVTQTGELITQDTLERYFQVGEIEWII
ncbi:MAG: biotin--[acetyl-CoA-carboxylase] ligase [Niastella sp.]|nr:biotin--[acetyl-CoA-carboxylase] ligase [Niastella sp.]